MRSRGVQISVNVEEEKKCDEEQTTVAAAAASFLGVNFELENGRSGTKKKV